MRGHGGMEVGFSDRALILFSIHGTGEKEPQEYSFGNERGLKGNVSKLKYDFCVVPIHCTE